MSISDSQLGVGGYSGVRVAVLGASGFIGRWVARCVCAQGGNAHLFVRDKAAAEEIFSLYQVQGEIHQLDLHHTEALEKRLRKVRPSITFNLAGYGVDRSEREEDSAYRINAEVLKAVCGSIAGARDPTWLGQDIVHAGSALEYGAIGGNLTEDALPNPTTLYGKSKLAGTLSLKSTCEALRLKGLTARLFTVYGPGEHRGRLLPSVIDAARTGRTLELTEGTQRRDFTHVEDVAEGLLRLGLTSGTRCEIVNLATGRLITVREFAELAAKLSRIPPGKMQFGALATRTEEMQHSAVTVERLRRLTAWVPPTDIEEGIRKTLCFERRCDP